VDTDRVPRDHTSGVRSYLSSEEIHACDQLVFERDRHQHLLTRMLVRLALSNYIPICPKDWAFARTELGKPVISIPIPVPIEFSLSHTAGIAVCAVTVGSQLGVDVEAQRMRGLPARCFCEQELEMLRALPLLEAARTSLSLWTLKESLLKAIGFGLSVEPNQVGFELDRASSPQLMLAPSAALPAEHWRFAQFEFRSLAIGAVAVRDPSRANLALQAIEFLPSDFAVRVRPLFEKTSIEEQ
jgi:4'-phosphopantetheinyl transferase